MKKRALVTGSILMMFLGLIYAWSLFAAPLEEAFSWTRSQTSTTFSISMISFCLGSLASGYLLKKHSLKFVLNLSAFLFLLGFFMASNISQLWQLFLSYGFLCGLGVGLSYNALLASIPPHFNEKMGLASGTLLMGMGLGSLLLGSLAERLIGNLGLKTSFRILALVFFLIFMTLSRLLILPEYKPRLSSSTKNMDLASMLRTKNFWLIFIWSTLISIIGLALVSNASFIAQESGIPVSLIALSVGILSLGNGFGRLLFGRIGDLIGAKKSMYLSSGFYLLGAGLLMLAGKTGLMPAFILVGLAYGSSSILSALLVKNIYGDKYYAQNLSAVVLILIPASLIGPRLAALIFSSQGSYAGLYPWILGLALLALLPSYMVKDSC